MDELEARDDATGGAQGDDEPTTFRERFLRVYAAHGAGYTNYKSFCADFHLNYNLMRNLRTQHRSFRKDMSEIERTWKEPTLKGQRKVDKEVTAAASKARDFAKLARSRWEHLAPPWKAIFLETYRKSRNRVDSAEQVSLTWEEVERQLDADPDFAKGYKVIEREIKIRVEDSFIQSAAAGRNSAAMARFLEVNDPRYAKRNGANSTRGGGGGGALPAEALSPVAREEARGLYRELYAASRRAPIPETTPTPELEGPEQDEEDELAVG